jgi:hypothetical protein
MRYVIVGLYVMIPHLVTWKLTCPFSFDTPEIDFMQLLVSIIRYVPGRCTPLSY